MKSLAGFGLMAAVALAIVSGCNNDSAAGSQKSYVLVHGAWMGAWCWSDVADGLRAKGATVTTVELPAHGDDQTPVAQATLQSYVDSVAAVADTAGPSVVLVGHSMGGMVITGVAEARAAKLAKLVYLGAYLPKDGQSLNDIAMTDADSHLGPALMIDPVAGLAKLPMEKLADIFIADGTADQIAKVVSHYRDEPLAPFLTPIHTTAAGWGSVPKAYIFTKNDHALSFSLQQTMTAGVAMTATTTLETSHAPFLSKPAQVISALESM